MMTMAVDKKVTVHLTTLSDSSAPPTGLETRVLTIPANGPKCVIGRSSKNSTKNLLPLRENALFECPVMSRHHAALSAPNGAYGPIIIEDTNSMHGVYLNNKKITNNMEYAEREISVGDHIRFGNPISRSDTVHEGLEVIVDDIVRDNISRGFPNLTELKRPRVTPPSFFRKPLENPAWPQASTAKVITESLDNKTVKKDEWGNTLGNNTSGHSGALDLSLPKKPITVFDDGRAENDREISVFKSNQPISVETDLEESVFSADDVRSEVSNSDSIEYAQDFDDSDDENVDSDEDEAEIDYEDEVDYDEDDIRSQRDVSSVRPQHADSDEDEDDDHEAEQVDDFGDAFIAKDCDKTSDAQHPTSLEHDKKKDKVETDKATEKVTEKLAGNIYHPEAELPTPTMQYPSDSIFTQYPGNTSVSNDICVPKCPAPDSWADVFRIAPRPVETESAPDWDWNRHDPYATVPAVKQLQQELFNFSSTMLPPVLTPQEAPPAPEAEYELDDEDDSVHAQTDSPVPESPAPAREEIVEGSSDVPALVDSPSSLLDSPVEGSSKTGEKRKRAVQDDDDQDLVNQAQSAICKSSINRSKDVDTLKNVSKELDDSIERPAKRVKRDESIKVSLGAAVGLTFGGLAAGIGFLMTPMCEELLAAWPV